MKKKQVYILIISLILVALIAASIAIPILIINNKTTVPQISFAEFDQLSDMTVKVEWKKISKAKSYDIEYCFGNPFDEDAVIVSGWTESTFFNIERKKGTLNVRVRAVYKSEKGEYCVWKTYIINPIKLTAPYVSISNNLLIEWSEVKYKYYNTRKNVPLYSYNLNIRSADDDFTVENRETNFNSDNIADYIMAYLGKFEYTQDTWDDVTITVSVKALNYARLGSEILVVGEYQFVHDVYEESDYISTSYTLTLADYQRLKAI